MYNDERVIFTSQTLVVDNTPAHAAGDVLAETVAMTLVGLPSRTGRAHQIEVVSVRVDDPDDQGVNLDVVLMVADNELGTINTAVDMTDAERKASLQKGGVVLVDTWHDFVIGQIGIEEGLHVPMEFEGTDIYVGMISRGTGTYAGAALELTIGYKVRT